MKFPGLLWLKVESFTDQGSNKSHNRSGFGLGAGQYRAEDNLNAWVAALIGREAASWNNINVVGNSSIKISGENDNQTFNLETGMIYTAMNLVLGARFDLVNQSIMFKLGYVFGGQKKGFIDLPFAN